MIHDYRLDGDLFRLELEAELLLQGLKEVGAAGFHVGARVQPVKRNVIKPLEAGAIFDGLAGVADQVVGQVRGSDSVPLCADVALDGPDAGNSGDWGRETVGAEVRSVETIGAGLWAFLLARLQRAWGRSFRSRVRSPGLPWAEYVPSVRSG